MEKAKLKALIVKKSDKSHNLQIKIDPKIIDKLNKHQIDISQTVRDMLATVAEDLK